MKPTASGLQRADICPAAFALPQVSVTSDHAEHGIVGHAFLETWGREGRERALVLAPRTDRDWLASLEPPVDPTAYRAEVALAVDVVTGIARELGEGLGRNYPHTTDDELVGTADLLRIEEDRVIVADWKFDFGPDASAAPISENLQVRMLALAAARCHGKDAATIQLIHLPDGGKPWIEEQHLDSFDLADIRLRLKDIAWRVRNAQRIVEEGRTPHVTQGAHCRWCSALPHCPGSTALVTLMADRPELLEQEIRAQLTPDNAAQAYRKWKIAKQLVDRIGGAIYAYAEQVGGIELGNGKVLGPTETRREAIDGGIARQVLAKLASPEVADAAVTFETSKAAIERALKPVADTFGQPLAGIMRTALQKIREAGGVEVKTTVTVKEASAKAKKEAA